MCCCTKHSGFRTFEQHICGTRLAVARDSAPRCRCHQCWGPQLWCGPGPKSNENRTVWSWKDLLLQSNFMFYRFFLGVFLGISKVYLRYIQGISRYSFPSWMHLVPGYLALAFGQVEYQIVLWKKTTHWFEIKTTYFQKMDDTTYDDRIWYMVIEYVIWWQDIIWWWVMMYGDRISYIVIGFDVWW